MCVLHFSLLMLFTRVCKTLGKLSSQSIAVADIHFDRSIALLVRISISIINQTEDALEEQLVT